jgi:hypothetical protein
MENDGPKTKLGAIFASLGAGLEVILTLCDRMVTKPPQGQRLKRREENTPTTPLTEQQERGAVIQGHSQAHRQRKYQRQTVKRLSRIISVFFVVFGALGTSVSIYSLLTTRLSAYPPPFLSGIHRLPFTEFTISNEGSLAVYDVYVTCSEKTWDANDHLKIITDPIGIHVDKLAPGDKITKQCRSEDLDIILHDGTYRPDSALYTDVSISYRASFYPWHQERIINFAAIRDMDGYPHWSQSPADSTVQIRQ